MVVLDHPGSGSDQPIGSGRKGVLQVKFECTDKCQDSFKQLKHQYWRSLPRVKSIPYIVMLQELVWVMC